MIKVQFYDRMDDNLLKFAVIITKADGKFVFCKHRKRDTYEIPGGHRERGEAILDTAKRELYEETGAVDYNISPICVYSVTDTTQVDGQETFGMLYFADVHEFERELHNEIEKIILVDELTKSWTYPEIQPKLLEEGMKRMA